jgi:hypothetical protein
MQKLWPFVFLTLELVREFTLSSVKDEIGSVYPARRRERGAQRATSDLDPNLLRAAPVDDAHFTTLMSNLNTARGFFSMPNVSFRVTPGPGVSISTLEIEDLRNGVK